MKTSPTATTLATLAAVASQSSAAVVQISLDDIFLSSTSNQLTADFTGDGNNDFVISGVTQTFLSPAAGFFSSTPSGFFTSSPGAPGTYRAALQIDGNQINASIRVSTYGGPLGTASSIDGVYASGVGLAGLIPITFNDANYGGVVNAWLDVNVSGTDPRIDLRRIIWDEADLGTRPAGVSADDSAFATATPIPEVSSLALLALGAGGLAARRRRAA